MTYPCLLGAVVITSANNIFKFLEGATTMTATITPGTYYLRDDNVLGEDLDRALSIAINAAPGIVNTYSTDVTRSIATGSFHSLWNMRRTSGAASWSILRDGTQTFDLDLIGISTTTAHNGSTKTSDRACGAIWASNDGYRKFNRNSRRVVGNSVTASGRNQQVSRSDRIQEYGMDCLFVHNSRLFIDEALTGPTNSLESFIDRFNAGSTIEVHDLEISSGTALTTPDSTTRLATVQFAEETLSEFDPLLIGDGINLYDIPLRFYKKV
jgi:hypothetical protein